MFSISVICAVTLTLVRRGRLILGTWLFIAGLISTVGAIMIAEQINTAGPIFGLVISMIVAAFLVGSRAAIIVGIVSEPLLLLASYTQLTSGSMTAPDWSDLVTNCLSMGSITVVVYLFSHEAGNNYGFLRRRLTQNEALFMEVPSAVNQLGAAASEIFAMTEQQTQGTMRQASAIEETRQVLHSVAQASGEIVASARQTLENAETTLRTSERVAENIRNLSTHTRDISRILDFIKDVANKSDLLALNAALEGTKAGEAGRGFSLVATQMQRLAENITVSVKDIRELTSDIRNATNTTQLSMEEATKLAQATTVASEQINLITQQQRTSVEQVASAMDDIATITNQVASGTNQTIISTEELKNLASNLTVVVEKFRAASTNLE